MHTPPMIDLRRRRLPVVLQSEVAECGLACLAMIASWHGHRVDLFALRSRFGVDLTGMTLKQLMACAEKLELTPRAVRADLDAIGRLQLPAIVHWNMNHFVVLAKVRGSRCLVHDPARGAQWLDRDAFSRGFTGVALELRPAPGFARADATAPLRLHQLWRTASGLRGSVVQIVLLALALQGFGLLLPYFMQLTLDHVVAGRDVGLLTALGLGFGLLALLKAGTEAARGWTVLYLGSSLNLQLGANLMRHLLKLPLDFFQKRHVGDLQSRFGALNQIRQTLTGGLIEGVVDGALALTTLALMLLYSGTLTAIAVVAMLVYVAIRLALFQPIRQATLDAVVKRARSESQFLETLRALLPVKVFGRERERHAAWLNLQTDAINGEARTGVLEIVYQTSQSAVVGLEYIALVWVGATLVLDGALTVGMLVAFLAYRQLFSHGSITLVDRALEYRMLGVHLSRLADIVLAEPERHADGVGVVRERVRGEIALRNVGFRYGEDQPWLFRHLDLVVRPGECIAFAGRSGCGKTTLLKIMLGLIEPTEGEVLLDGVDIRRLGLSAYRGLCAAVMQEDQLISGSLRDNISLQDPQPDAQRIDACAAQACIRDDILRMPMGFESLIGDMGAALSGGQQQRLLLARALYAAPLLLFLDEATSALDGATEAEVNANVRRLGITRIMIAHRRETLALADRVVDLSMSVTARSAAA